MNCIVSSIKVNFKRKEKYTYSLILETTINILGCFFPIFFLCMIWFVSLVLHRCMVILNITKLCLLGKMHLLYKYVIYSHFTKKENVY